MKTAKKAALVLATAGLAAGAASGSAFAHDGSGATAKGAAVGSPGVLSGNLVQVPVHVPVNLCGNTVNVIGLLNPAFGNTCVNS
ncbi:chaplin [Streptomyces sp. NPDC048441]|uniref:chaplin n=1 Tax=Streptomyces sp. NPDC048441 TaxID=3365552 RepID=UPI00372116FC